MTEEVFNISDLDLIGAGEAGKILETKHRSNLPKLIKTYKIPHKVVSTRNVFLRRDIEEVRDSEFRQKNLVRRNGKIPRKKIEKETNTTLIPDIRKLDLISTAEALKIFGISHKNHLYVLIKKYEIPYKKLPFGSVFIRSDVEKAEKSERRQNNLKHRRKDQKK